MKIDEPRLHRELLTTVTELPEEDLLSELLLDNLTLTEDTLNGRELRACVLYKCDLSGVVMHRGGFVDVIFDHCDLSGIRWEDSAFHRVQFDACRLTGTDMTTCTLMNASFTSCRGDYLNLSGAKLEHTAFRSCNLREAAFEQCRIKQLSFDACDLTHAAFHQTPMKGVDMRTNRIGGLVIAMSDLVGMIVTPAQAADLATMLRLVIKERDDE